MNQSQKFNCADKHILGEGISAQLNPNNDLHRKSTHGSHGNSNKPRPPGGFYRRPPPAMALLLDTIARARVVRSPTDLILDAGAGDGPLTRPLIKAGYRVRGFELHDRQHDLALLITINRLPREAMDLCTFTSLLDAAHLVVASVIDAGDGKLADEQVTKHRTAAADIAEEHSL